MAPLYGTVQKWKLRVNALPHTGDRKKNSQLVQLAQKVLVWHRQLKSLQVFEHNRDIVEHVIILGAVSIE